MRELTTIEKAKVMCLEDAECAVESSSTRNWYETLWSGLPGYAPKDPPNSPKFREWAQQIEDDWSHRELPEECIRDHCEKLDIDLRSRPRT
jgi:hypothetical protein